MFQQIDACAVGYGLKFKFDILVKIQRFNGYGELPK